MDTKIETKIVYFNKVSPDTTDTTLSIAKQRAGELGIKTILVASTFGDTGVKAVDVFKGYKVVVVGHSYGHRGPNMTPFADEKRKYIESKGGVVCFAPEAFVGLGLTASRAPAPGSPPPSRAGSDLEVGNIIANSLKMFCQGIKVVVECSLMAASAGLVRTDEDIIAIAGTGRGADTAVVMRPSIPQYVFRSRIREILCKASHDYVVSAPDSAGVEHVTQVPL